MNRNSGKRPQRGMTMIELVMVITITGILAAVGTASFKYVNSANRISAETNNLLGDLQFARSEAIKEGLPVTVCPTTDFNSCNASSTWTSGWLVYVDMGAIGTYVTGTDQLLRKGGLNSGSTDTLVGSDSAMSFVSFNREGFVSFSGTGITTTWGTLVLQTNPVNANWKRCIAISKVGAITSERGGASVPASC